MKTYLIYGAGHLALLALLLTLYWKNRRQKKQQDQLVSKLRGQHFWRINLARPAFFQRWLRLMPGEAKGVLIDDGDAFRIKGFWLKDNRAFDSRIPKSSAAVEWLGNQSLRSGNLHWAQLTTPKGPLLFSADTGMYALPSREALADIFRAAFPDYPLGASHTADFALEKNPRSLGTAILFLALMAFALLDTFVFNPLEVPDVQIGWILGNPLTWVSVIVLAGALGFGLYRFLTAASVPSRESWALTFMTTLMVLAAALPLAKRVDQLLASEAARPYAYRVAQPNRLEPVDTKLGLPPLMFPRMRDYWTDYGVGKEVQVPYLRGPMGLWQLDHDQFGPPIRAYYEKKDAAAGR